MRHLEADVCGRALEGTGELGEASCRGDGEALGHSQEKDLVQSRASLDEAFQVGNVGLDKVSLGFTSGLPVSRGGEVQMSQIPEHIGFCRNGERNSTPQFTAAFASNWRLHPFQPFSMLRFFGAQCVWLPRGAMRPCRLLCSALEPVG